jgi:hypothetical protein
MKTYKFIIKHDNGVQHLTTTASDAKTAIQKVMNFENCPKSAITRLTETTLIEDNKTLKRLNDEGLIVWPCLINNSKGIKFKYCESVNDQSSFKDSKGNEYRLEYHSGCFMPYVYKVKTIKI